MNKLLENLQPYNQEKLEIKQLVFRNYVPRSEELKEFVVRAPTTVAEVELNIEREIRNALKEFERQQKEPLTLVPKKANWDLKRKLNEKLDPLQRITEKSIREIKKQIKSSKLK
jgi:coiled-coil domain-containing protein 12